MAILSCAPAPHPQIWNSFWNHASHVLHSCFLLFRVASIEGHQKKGNDNPKRSSFNRQVQGRDTMLLSQIGSRIAPSPGLSIASDGKTIYCQCSGIGKPATVVSDVSAIAHLVRAAYLSLNGYGYIRHPLMWCFLIRSRHINHSRAFRRACYLIPHHPKNIDVWETNLWSFQGSWWRNSNSAYRNYAEKLNNVCFEPETQFIDFPILIMFCFSWF